MLQGPGENAGVIDLGEGEAVAFKVESHNHPSAVEPFQGAATGVGGILRDISAMGARPVALLDGLYFGDPGWMFRRAVAGIGHYGNCVGVPNVGGETRFDEAYRDNVLVNAMCVGLLPSERVTRAKARTAGHAVVLYGATTGRDGIGGASVLASAELAADDADKRPSVQVGDPFTGKKLIEASLELVEGGLVESLQDCGAAGLASSLSEMASEIGIDVHLDRVPLREPDLEPWEVMISESQERMVAVVRKDFLPRVEQVCAKWELAFAVVGEVTTTGELRAFWDDEVVGAIPARLLTDECPRYDVDREAPATPTPSWTATYSPSEPNLASKEWVYRQYDQLVGSRTVRRPGLDAAVLRLRPSLRGLAVSLAGAAARRARPVPRRPAGRVRRCAERRVRRRRAARADRLPQLRQPGEARDRVGARARDRGDRAGRGSARDPGRLRATSRSTTRRTDARSRRHRSSVASASSRTCATCRRAGARATRSWPRRRRRAEGRGRADPVRRPRVPPALARARRRRRRRRGSARRGRALERRRRRGGDPRAARA